MKDNGRKYFQNRYLYNGIENNIIRQSDMV